MYIRSSKRRAGHSRKTGLERILDHWGDDAEFTSPWIVVLFDEPSGTLVGKDALRGYWRLALEGGPVHFEPRALLMGRDSVVLSYQNHRGQECAETLILGSDGLAHWGFAHYSPSVVSVLASSATRQS